MEKLGFPTFASWNDNEIISWSQSYKRNLVFKNSNLILTSILIINNLVNDQNWSNVA